MKICKYLLCFCQILMQIISCVPIDLKRFPDFVAFVTGFDFIFTNICKTYKQHWLEWYLVLYFSNESFLHLKIFSRLTKHSKVQLLNHSLLWWEEKLMTRDIVLDLRNLCKESSCKKYLILDSKVYSDEQKIKEFI